MEEKIKIGILFGIYGKMLTENQYEILNDYYNKDLSISEIAENNKITRQAVNDVINKGKNKLIEMENKLNFEKKIINQKKQIEDISNQLKKQKNKILDEKEFEIIQNKIKKLENLVLDNL